MRPAARRWSRLRLGLVGAATFAVMLTVPAAIPNRSTATRPQPAESAVPISRSAPPSRTQTLGSSAADRRASTAPSAQAGFRRAYMVGLPRVVRRYIPYPARRKAEMAAYAGAHYGMRTWRLRPQAVVLHFTESDSASAVIAQFSRDTPNHGELPGVCAHYLVDTDGTVYELVPTSVMCRHAIGLNHRAIGIEVVQSTHGHTPAWADRQILNRTAQVRSLLLLVASLQDRYAIPTSRIEGHGTANASPLFGDRKGWRNTHTDWGAPAVAEFRRRLTALAAS